MKRCQQILFGMGMMLVLSTVTGCISTSQNIFETRKSTVPITECAEIVVHRPFVPVGVGVGVEVADGDAYIGSVGPTGELRWRRPAGHMALQSGEVRTIDRVNAGKVYRYDVSLDGTIIPVNRNPEQIFRPVAPQYNSWRDELRTLDFEQARTVNTVAAYQRFARQYPRTKLAKEASKLAESLTSDGK